MWLNGLKSKAAELWTWTLKFNFVNFCNAVQCVCAYTHTAWCSEIGSLMSLDAPELHAPSDVTTNRLHQAVCLKTSFTCQLVKVGYHWYRLERMALWTATQLRVHVQSNHCAIFSVLYFTWAISKHAKLVYNYSQKHWLFRPTAWVGLGCHQCSAGCVASWTQEVIPSLDTPLLWDKC